MFLKIFLIALPLMIGSNFTPDYQLEFFNFSIFPELYRRDYTAFTCWLSCKDRLTVMCHYMGFPDEENHPRNQSFAKDPLVPATCQQTSTATYNSIQDGWDL